jgi:chemotaxis protein methyltransferase CheR
MNHAVGEQEQRRTDIEIDLLLEGLLQMYEVDFRQHDRKPLVEKVSHFAAERGMASVSALLAQIMYDDKFAAALCKSLVADRTSLLERPGELAAIREVIAATLPTYPAPRIWLAECASTEEIFAVAVLMSAAKLFEKSTIFVTCSSEVLLNDIRECRIDPERMELYQQMLDEYGNGHAMKEFITRRNGSFALSKQVKSRICWFHYNLLLGSSFNEFQFISCRNSFLNFSDVARRRVLRLFHNSLSSFGVLNLGENLNGAGIGLGKYRPLNAGGVFQRIF